MTPNTQEFKFSGDSVLGKIKELVHEGHVHRVTKNGDGHTQTSCLNVGCLYIGKFVLGNPEATRS